MKPGTPRAEGVAETRFLSYSGQCHLSGELFIKEIFSGSERKSWPFNIPFSTTETLGSDIAKNWECPFSKDFASNTRSFRRKLLLSKVCERLLVSRINIFSSYFPKGVEKPCLVWAKASFMSLCWDSLLLNVPSCFVLKNTGKLLNNSPL